MARSAALFVICAALAVFVLQAVLSWTPEGRTLAGRSTLHVNADVATEDGALLASLSVVHESRARPPPGWTPLGAAPPTKQLELTISLKSKDAAGLRKRLVAQSTPGDPLYGKKLSAAQITRDFMGPSTEGAKAITEFFGVERHDLKPVPGHGDQIRLRTTVADVNSLFNTQMLDWQFKNRGPEVVRTLSYSLPPEIKEYVAFVHPLTTFPTPKARVSSAVFEMPLRRWASRDSETSCRNRITPACVQQAYGLPTGAANASDTGGNAITVTGYLGQFPQDDNLNSFLQQFRPDMDASTPFTLQTADDGSELQDVTIDEANLDIQYTVGLATGVPVNFLSIGNDVHDGGLDGFLDTVSLVSSQDAMSTVMTTSYGFNEEELGRPLAEKLCDAYAALGVQGVSVIFSSGDGGVAGTSNDDCEEFVPTFPATCPYVTTVGATTGVPETAASLSAGGFSNYFAWPDYQADAVNAYLGGLDDTYAGLFNVSGRAYPDVAAYGQNVVFTSGGQTMSADGTSCAAPMFAATVALLNDQLLAANMSTLGFLNPWLYANPGALNDIMQGSNPGCGTDGFLATTGWDPVTGLGSPNFPALVHALGI